MFNFRKPLNETVIIISSHLCLLSLTDSEYCMPGVGKVCIRDRIAELLMRTDGRKKSFEIVKEKDGFISKSVP